MSLLFTTVFPVRSNPVWHIVRTKSVFVKWIKILENRSNEQLWAILLQINHGKLSIEFLFKTCGNINSKNTSH